VGTRETGLGSRCGVMPEAPMFVGASRAGGAGARLAMGRVFGKLAIALRAVARAPSVPRSSCMFSSLSARQVEKLADPVSVAAEVVARCPAEQLMTVYRIPAFSGPDEFLRHVAAARGKLKKGGVADAEAAARTVLADWNDGRIPFYTMPPARGGAEHSSAEVLTAFSREFNADEVRAFAVVLPPLPSFARASRNEIVADFGCRQLLTWLETAASRLEFRGEFCPAGNIHRRYDAKP
jgi:hypothetical protein